MVGITSMVVHYARRARGDVWIADEEDTAAIAAPLARITARHSPIHGDQASDVADGFAAALGVAGYAIKNIRRELWAEAHLAHLGAPQEPRDGPEPPPAL